MKRLGETTIPAEIYEWNALSDLTRRWYMNELPEAFVGYGPTP